MQPPLPGSQLHPVMPYGFGKNAVKERILAVMSAGKTPVSGIFAAVLTVALAMTVFYYHDS